MKKSILTLFGFNLEDLPDSSFMEDLSEENSQGALIKNYSKFFNDKTYHLFETVSIKHFGNCYNIFFKSHNLKKINLYAFRKLTNDLAKIYGPDSTGKGKYSTQDFSDLKDKNLTFCGRNWMGIENEILPCDLECDKELKTLTLSLFGVGLNKNAAAIK